MPDNDSILSGLFQGYQYATPEQRRRAQEHAYALLKQPDERYTSWTQGARDIVNALVGRHIINQTNSQEAQQLNDLGERQGGFLGGIQRRNEAERNKQSSITPQFTAPTPAPITTGSLSPEAAGGIAGGTQPTSEGDIASTGNPIEAPKTGVKLDEYLKKLMGPESSNGTNTKINQYGYGGPFGLRKGENGLNDQNWGDNVAHVRAAASKTLENIAAYRKVYDRDPTDEELHLMHNQGATGGLAHMGSEPDKPAYKVLMDSNPGLKEDLAKTRIKAQIGSGSSLSKQPVEKITTGEFQDYMADKFNGGWRSSTNISKNRMPGQIGGGAIGASDTPAVAAAQGQKVAQAAMPPAVPPAIASPSASVDIDNLKQLLKNPMLPQSDRDMINKMMIEGGANKGRETAAGKEEYAGGNPNIRTSPGAVQADRSISLHGLTIPMTEYTHPTTGVRTPMFAIPGHGLTDAEGLAKWSNGIEAQRARTVGTATHETKRYTDLHEQLVNRAYGVGGAVDEMEHIKKAQNLMESPAFIHGTATEQRTQLRNFVDSITGNDPGEAAASTAFVKLIAGNTLNDIKSLGDSHAGPVRVGEMNIINKMNANPELPMGSMRMILDLAQRTKARMKDVADMAMQYRKDHGQLDEGFDRELAAWRNKPENHLIKDDEMKNFNAMFRKQIEEKPGSPKFEKIPEGRHLGRQYREIELERPVEK